MGCVQIQTGAWPSVLSRYALKERTLYHFQYKANTRQKTSVMTRQAL